MTLCTHGVALTFSQTMHPCRSTVDDRDAHASLSSGHRR